MRKILFIAPSCAILSLFCLLTLQAFQVAAQEAVPVPASLPSNPKKLMELAATLNGLTGTVSPWHIKASYTLYDQDGKASNQGTYEEFWVSPTKFKRIIEQGSFTQTDFGTGNGILRSGAKDQHSFYIDQMRQSLIVPFPPAAGIDQGNFQKVEMKKEHLTCLESDNGLAYCLDSGQLALRVYSSARANYQVDRSRILTFQQRFIAGDLTISLAGKPALTAHVDTLELLAPINDADFTPPADVSPFHRRINVSAGVAVGMLQYNPPPAYPADAKAAGISGTVVLRATIDTDGRVTDLSIDQGPQELQQAALDAVRTWRYRPYLLNNEPVEVHTQVNVNFSLKGH
jgi:TonB family protein